MVKKTAASTSKQEKAAPAKEKAKPAVKVVKADPVETKQSKKEKDKKSKNNFDGTISIGIADTKYRYLKNKALMSMWRTVLGTPGFVKGKVYEFSGKSDVGKSALASSLAADFQSQGETTGYNNVEKVLNKDFAIKLGYDPKKLVVINPHDGESAFLGACKIIRENNVKVLVFDSSGACTPRAVMNGESSMAQLARLTSVEMPKLDKEVDINEVTVFMISQVKDKPGVVFGNPEYVTGGSAVGFYSRVRIKLNAVEAEKGKDEMASQRIAYTVRMTVFKNHTGPKRTVPFDMVVDNMFRPLLPETAYKWAQKFNLIDEKKNSVCGVEVTGKMTAANIVKALDGNEAAVFDAVDAIFARLESGEKVALPEEEADVGLDDVNDSGDFTTVEISEEELENSKKI